MAGQSDPGNEDLRFHDWTGLVLNESGLVTGRRYEVGYIAIAEAPAVARLGVFQRAKATGRHSRIDDETRHRLPVLASDGLSLRAIARELGMSHESVPRVLVAPTVSVQEREMTKAIMMKTDICEGRLLARRSSCGQEL